MEIITVAQRKGGTGKTATALNLGAGLRRNGKRILFIDLDSQGNLTKNLRINTERVKHSSFDVLTGSSTAEEAIVKTAEGDLIPASAELAALDIQSITWNRKEYRLRDALEPIKGRYDVIILDTPPALGISLINALTASQSAIIPCEARQGSLDGIEQLYGTIEAVQRRTNKDLKIRGIVVTRCKAQTILTRDMIENLRDAASDLGTKLYDTQIRENTAIGEAESMRQSIFEYAPKSNGAIDYESLTQEILREER